MTRRRTRNETGTRVHIEEFELAHGELRFPARAMGEGPVVLCLHGFPDDWHSFDEQLPVLAEAGYRAVSVTMRGYAPSCQPEDRDYSVEALCADVLAWIEQLGAEGQPVHVVGHDWGAVVAYLAGAQAPAYLSTITAIAVPNTGRFMREVTQHPKQLRLSWYMGFFQLPVVPEYWVRRDDFAFLSWLWRSWSPGWDFGDAMERVKETFRQPGVIRGALAYYRRNISPQRLRSGGNDDLSPAISVPALCVTGDEDGCIDSQVFEALTQPEDFSAGLRFERIHGAGHWVHRERADEFNALLLDWLEAYTD